MSFQVNKSAAADQAVASVAPTKVTFDGLSYDDDDAFDLGNSRVTPRAGRHAFHAVLMLTGVTVEQIALAIYKDGVEWRKVNWRIGGGGVGVDDTIAILAHDRTDGTHYYEVFVDSTADAAYTVRGVESKTWFEGWELA